MSKQKFSEIYLASNVIVPVGKENHYKGLTIDDNTAFLEYMVKRVDEESSLIEKKPNLRYTINFKVRKEYTKMYMELKRKLKENNRSFSSLYRELFDEFMAMRRK
jgi:hypothetical protein